MRLMRKKRPDLLQRVIFYQDNAPSHRAASTQAVIHDLGFELLEHPAYSPDLAPCDFFLFPAMKKNLRGQHFDELSELPQAVQRSIADLPEDGYRNSFSSWGSRCRKCISFKGEYFEKNDDAM